MIKVVGCMPRGSMDRGQAQRDPVHDTGDPVRRRTVFNELAAMSQSVAESRCEYCGTSGRCAVCGSDNEEPQMSEAGYQALWRALVEPGEWEYESDPESRVGDEAPHA